MKKVLSITLVTIFLIGINALAYGGDAEKVTGEITTQYMNEHIVFDAQETEPSANLGKGSVSYSRPAEFAYQFDVKYVRVEPEEHVAWFAGQVIYTSNGENLGRWMSFVVCDEVSEKYTTDMLGSHWIPDGQPVEDQEAIALEWVTNGLPDSDKSAIAIEGNLTVHKVKDN